MGQLFILGDSISIHYGKYLSQNLHPLIKCNRKGGMEIDDITNPNSNAGDSREILSYLQAGMPNCSDYDMLLLNCGLHDIRRSKEDNIINVSPEEYAENLKNIVMLAFKKFQKIIWCESTPVVDKNHNRLQPSFYRFNKDVKNYNHIANSIMNDFHIPVIPLYGFVDAYGEKVFCDHVHFLENQRALQAAFIAGWILREEKLICPPYMQTGLNFPNDGSIAK